MGEGILLLHIIIIIIIVVIIRKLSQHGRRSPPPSPREEKQLDSMEVFVCSFVQVASGIFFRIAIRLKKVEMSGAQSSVGSTQL